MKNYVSAGYTRSDADVKLAYAAVRNGYDVDPESGSFTAGEITKNMLAIALDMKKN